MNDAEKIVLLFLNADRMMSSYIDSLSNLQAHMLAAIEKDTPLPSGAISALKQSAGNIFLKNGIHEIERAKIALWSHLGALRKCLAAPEKSEDIAIATLLTFDWANNASHLLESVLNEKYSDESTISSPFSYWRPVFNEWDKIFLKNDDKELTQKDEETFLYLTNVDNPWSRK